MTVRCPKSQIKVKLLYDSAIRLPELYLIKIKNICIVAKTSAQQFIGTLLTTAKSRHNSNAC